MAFSSFLRLAKKQNFVLNGIIGATCYAIGDVVTNASDPKPKPLSMEKLGKVASFGAFENGLVMGCLYNYLDKKIGISNGTKMALSSVWLIKCFFPPKRIRCF